MTISAKVTCLNGTVRSTEQYANADEFADSLRGLPARAIELMVVADNPTDLHDVARVMPVIAETMSHPLCRGEVEKK